MLHNLTKFENLLVIDFFLLRRDALKEQIVIDDSKHHLKMLTFRRIFIEIRKF